MTPQPYPYGSTPNEDAETTRDVARQQGDEVKDEVAQQAQSVASTVADETSHVGTTGFDGMVDDVESFARRRPGAFLAGAAVAGVAASRLGRGDQASEQEQNGSGTSSVGEASTHQAAPTAAPALASPPPVPAGETAGATPSMAANAPGDPIAPPRDPVRAEPWSSEQVLR